ncbi:MAG: hypothetical protein KBG11_08485, partial [Bacteroidia bacterium]|nr:hypothetical protein [Bacteroidia bacterium]
MKKNLHFSQDYFVSKLGIVMLCFLMAMLLPFQVLFGQEVATNNTYPWSNEVSNNQEVIGLRSRTAKHYLLNEGRYKAYFSVSSIHYKEGFEWKEIKNDIEPSSTLEGYYQNTTNSFKSYYPKQLDKNAIKTIVNGAEITEEFNGVYFINANKTLLKQVELGFGNERVDANSINYQTNINGLSQKYSQLSDGRKSDLILENPSLLKLAPAQTKYIAIKDIIEFPTGWVVKLENNNVNLYDAQGVWRANYQAPVAYQEAIKTEGDMSEGLITFAPLSSNKIALTTLFNYAWLTDKNRVYPLHLDPTVTFNPFNVAM